MAEIKAIETRYKGYRFRSRLEARWAVFFETLKIPWEYEKEGYDLGEEGWYLPDFWLPDVTAHEDTGVFVEVKPSRGYETEKLESIVRLSQRTAILLNGLPASAFNREEEGYYACLWMDMSECPDDQDPFEYESEETNSTTYLDSYNSFSECPRCHHVYFRFYGSAGDCDICGAYIEEDTPRIMNAYEAARSARFEHGERC